MGSLCLSKELTPTTPTASEYFELHSIKNFTEFRRTKFLFSSEKINKSKGDLLILFMDHSVNLQKNNHFVKLSKQAKKLSEFASSHFETFGDKMDAKFITFQIDIRKLDYKWVSLVFCNIWLEERRNEENFKWLIGEYFKSLGDLKIDSMVISQFPSFLGIHLQRGAKRIMREVAKMPYKPELIKFCCLTNESKEIYRRQIHENKSGLLESFSTVLSFPETDYF